ncbi:DNA replication protein DnaC [Buchnera aphidicola]|uniref:Replicative helicase loader DnaC n=1 Tax=Buchnera aphidicola (Cinara cf. splendens/pseudotsugae 3390) TaxID=2518980 RepID=A0A451CW79_9GAMM|nr:DNA replication protein DnaC [Buchnera aphidicola]VFP77587.1 DNA replication protein DnaC [Buchnera aphidicola (Cinara cf. splendens/pseudotsugae 3390)]
MNNFLKKLKKIMPAYIEPKFFNDKELLSWNQEQGKKYSESIIQKNKATKIQRILGRSGIRELYKNCSFENYKINHEGHKTVLCAARRYAENFKNNISSFIFSGRPGTGKNHLASAIGNYLILRGNNILIITVADLMSTLKSTFNQSSSKITEEKLLYNFSTVDLLIIDEIGMQTESRYEKMIINQIIDRRSSSQKPTGILSNLNHKKLNSLLGERVLDRMSLGNSLWLTFEWESYRKNVQINQR